MAKDPTTTSANMLPQFDIPQLRYIELPPRHPQTNSLCEFDDSATPVYPRNSYNVPTPPGHDPDSSWWPDGLNELDPRPRNLLENCRKAVAAGPRNRFWHRLARLPDDEPRGEPSNIREYMYQRKWQEIRREKAKEAVADAVSKEVVEENKEEARNATMDQEARKEFKKRQKATSYLHHGLASCKFPRKFRDIILEDFKSTDEEIAEKKFLRPWITSLPVSTRRPTVCYSPPDPKEVRKQGRLKKEKRNEHDAAIMLYRMWEDSPLGVPDAEGSEGKMWGEYMGRVRRGEIEVEERRD